MGFLPFIQILCDIWLLATLSDTKFIFPKQSKHVSNSTTGVGLKRLCVHVAMLHPGETSTMPFQQPPLIRSPTLTPSPLTHHTHTLKTHTHIRARTRAQPPRHPSPHHPQTSPLSLFQGAHGKPPESAGLRRTWAWPNSFPWLWTWDHPLLIFLSYPFLFVAFALFSSFHRP